MKSNRWINRTVLFVLVVGSFGARSAGNHSVAAAPLVESVLFVSPDSDGECTSWADACGLQYALDEAVYGDQIWAASGIYTPTYQTDPTDAQSATFEMKSGVAIYGGFAGSESELSERDWEINLTVLSGDLDGDDITDPTGVVTNTNNIIGSNAYHVVISEGVTETSFLDGFTITGGFANGEDSYPCSEKCGGGLFNVLSSPALSNVIFSGNRASEGGGMYNATSSPVLTEITFYGNKAGYGGGMYNWFNSRPVVTNVVFTSNIAIDNGGGMYNNNYSSPILTNAIFSNNMVIEDGGGIYNNGNSSPVLTGVTFNGNKAYYRGGGMYNEWNSSPILYNVTFSGNAANYGGGMYNKNYSSPRLNNVTFSGNTAKYNGGGMCNYYSSSSPRITNTILWGNSAEGSGPQILNEGDVSPTISFSDIQGACESISGNDCSGGGNIDADPLFVRNPDPGPDGTWGTEDDDYGDLRIRPLSPAIDSGDNSAVPTGVTTDLDGNPRFADIPGAADTGSGTAPIVDMGAYEVLNLAPIAEDDPNYSADNITLFVVEAPGVLENDSDPNLDPLFAGIGDSPSMGDLTLNADGSFEYLPETGYTGIVTFTYQATDGLLTSLPATVTVTVEQGQRTIFLPLITH